jgi:hypothetical protein
MPSCLPLDCTTGVQFLDFAGRLGRGYVAIQGVANFAYTEFSEVLEVGCLLLGASSHKISRPKWEHALMTFGVLLH